MDCVVDVRIRLKLSLIVGGVVHPCTIMQWAVDIVCEMNPLVIVL